MAAENDVTMVVQVNGKVRDTIGVSAAISQDEMQRLALASEKVRAHLGGRPATKVITKPPRVVSLVVADA